MFATFGFATNFASVVVVLSCHPRICHWLCHCCGVAWGTPRMQYPTMSASTYSCKSSSVGLRISSLPSSHWIKFSQRRSKREMEICWDSLDWKLIIDLSFKHYSCYCYIWNFLLLYEVFTVPHVFWAESAEYEHLAWTLHGLHTDSAQTGRLPIWHRSPHNWCFQSTWSPHGVRAFSSDPTDCTQTSPS